ncbi:hypothetical protein [Lewinella sp. W8]|uniref:hypothetical protein n=1 Tax=Lewinella sp. W8 TaxID=2528208 RepID=UPI001067588D|nr:hypothetical protein [Lewinella sp. W8]MTB51514.1 hypothetical protein [Lewinella sp. W8]
MRQIVWILFFTVCCCCAEESHLNDFPAEKFERVVAYKLSGEPGEVIEDGQLSRLVTGEEEVLNSGEVRKLLAILANKTTYSNTAALCFDPHIGYVFYGKQNEVVGHSTICFHCYQIRTTPDIGDFMLSERGIERLAAIEKRIFEQ